MPIDIARGIAIIGVVFNHAVDGLISAGFITESSLVGQINMALYIFRMPALFLLVGLFVPMGVGRKGAGRYIAGRAALLLWLFLVWQVIQGTAEAVTSGVRNGESTLLQVAYVWAPVGHLWFLPTLAVATAVAVVSRCWEPTARGRLGLGLLVVFGAFAWGWSLEWSGVRGLALVAFLAVGAALGLDRLGALLDRRPLLWAGVAVLALAATIALIPMGTEPATYSGEAHLGVQFLSMISAAFGVTAILALSAVIARIRFVSTALVAVGKRTLGIYLAHVIVVAGGRIGLAAIGVDESWVMLVVLVPAGVLIPILIESLARRWGAGWLFALPTPLERIVSRRSTRAVSEVGSAR